VDAIPTIATNVCANTAPPVDQRGTSRPQGSGCDIGAYELAGGGSGSTTSTGTVTPTPTITATATATAAPSNPTTNTQPATSSVGPSGGAVVSVSGTTSFSGGVTVVGAAGANTGVADIPTGFVVGPLLPNAAPPLDPSVITGTAPAPISANISAQTGGIILAGNAAIIVPPGAIASVPGGIVNVSVALATNVPVPGGPAQFSPNGSVYEIRFTDSAGNPVTTFPVPIPIEVKYNAADLSQAKGDPSTLTTAYVIDALTPPIANPLGLPPGTFLLFPAENVSRNLQTGTLVTTTRAIGSTISVVTNPVGYVQTTGDSTPVLSSFDPGTSQTFGEKPQFSYFQVVEPQIGNRLLVLDPDTGNYGYVNAADVGPSGPPPPKSASAVVRGLLDGKTSPAPPRR
jgi:hypothetical protein